MPQSLDERKLVADLKLGKREAFEELLDMYQDKVYSLVCRMVSGSDAEDIAQEALIEICRSIQNFKDRSKLSTWVYRVTVNVCLEHRRKKNLELLPLDNDLIDNIPDRDSDPVKAVQQSILSVHIDSIIQSLPDIHRDVVLLHELHGLTYKECADVLGCPVGTVKSRLAGAFEKLRVLLSDFANEGGVAI